MSVYYEPVIQLKGSFVTQEVEHLDDFSQTDDADETIQSLRKQMELPPGEERDASFRVREGSPDSIMSGGKIALHVYAV